jgi:hypothetical protein
METAMKFRKRMVPPRRICYASEWWIGGAIIRQIIFGRNIFVARIDTKQFPCGRNIIDKLLKLKQAQHLKNLHN